MCDRMLFVLLLLCIFPTSIYCQPGPDNLNINDCLANTIDVGGVKITGLPQACITGSISRCDHLNGTLHITIGNTVNRTFNISEGGDVDPAIRFSIPSSVCNGGAEAVLHFDPAYWKLNPSYVQIRPYIQFQTTCQVCLPPPLNHQCAPPVTVPQIARTFSVGADCSSAKTCDACASKTEPGNSSPCGWCQSSQTCFASNPQHEPYCTFPCATPGGLFTTHAQCTAAIAAQSTTDSAWSAGKTATVVILAIVLPIVVIIFALCLRRSYTRHRATKGATSGVGSIQAHVQGYRPTSESVSTEVSTNASTTAEFRQLEGYNPPSTRPTIDSHV